MQSNYFLHQVSFTSQIGLAFQPLHGASSSLSEDSWAQNSVATSRCIPVALVNIFRYYSHTWARGERGAIPVLKVKTPPLTLKPNIGHLQSKFLTFVKFVPKWTKLSLWPLIVEKKFFPLSFSVTSNFTLSLEPFLGVLPSLRHFPPPGKRKKNVVLGNVTGFYMFVTSPVCRRESSLEGCHHPTRRIHRNFLDPSRWRTDQVPSLLLRWHRSSSRSSVEDHLDSEDNNFTYDVSLATTCFYLVLRELPRNPLCF